jgi:aconitate hydratase
MLLTAKVLKGKKINKNVSLTISPGSRQVLAMLSQSKALFDIIQSGARILESTCGPCIGMGQAPKNKAVSLRTFNRNFEGRSGTKDAQVYLCSPEVALAAALTGKITDPKKYFDKKPDIKIPEKFLVDDAQFQLPAENNLRVEVIKGANIRSLSDFVPLDNSLSGKIVLKVGNNISTDHILPAGAKVLPLRSNLPAISEYIFTSIDKNFASRAKATQNGIIVGGENYGQGSSREHAALAPRYLGIRVILVKSFARIHLANIINFGIIPLTFNKLADYDKIKLNDKFEINNIKNTMINNEPLRAKIADNEITVTYALTQRQKDIIFSGGLLNWIKENA